MNIAKSRQVSSLHRSLSRSFWGRPIVAVLAAAHSMGCGSSPASCEERVAIPAEARSCELLIEDSGGSVDEVSFGAGAIGEWVRQAPRTAIALHAARDAAMGADAITVRLQGGGGYVVVSSQCFDGESREIESELSDVEDACHE